MHYLVIDGNNILHRVMRSSQGVLESHEGIPTGGIYGFLKALKRYLDDIDPDQCIVVFDGGISARRREIYPEYKGARYRDKDDPLYEEKDEQAAEYTEKFHTQRKILTGILKRLYIRVIRFDDKEADDVIHALTTAMIVSPYDTRVTIVSDDSDMLQMVAEEPGWWLEVYRPSLDKVVDVDNFEKIAKCTWPQFLVKKAIVGDPGSDNIKGVHLVGGKTVDTLFAEGMPVCHYPFQDMMIFCDAHKSKKAHRISDNIDIVIRNYELMALHMEDNTEIMDDLKDALFGENDDICVDMEHFKRMCVKLNMFSIMNDIRNWTASFRKLALVGKVLDA